MTYGHIPHKHDQISPEQELWTHVQTDSNDVRPHTTQTSPDLTRTGAPDTHTNRRKGHMAAYCTNNKRTSMESNLVTAQRTAHEPPEDGHTYGPKHVGAT
jgi:hypothetical protein